MRAYVDEHLDRLTDAARLCEQVIDNVPMAISLVARTRINQALTTAHAEIEAAHNMLKGAAE